MCDEFRVHHVCRLNAAGGDLDSGSHDQGIVLADDLDKFTREQVGHFINVTKFFGMIP
ncbi:MAG: hypothetical protein LBU24_02285 [Methanocalculaceae archaeon]|nr:hypothetical protein [Methanocalculaceae archaeon]